MHSGHALTMMEQQMQGEALMSPFRFLDLPREIRDMIYSELLEFGVVSLCPIPLELLDGQLSHKRWYNRCLISRARWIEKCGCGGNFLFHTSNKVTVNNGDGNEESDTNDEDEYGHFISLTYEHASTQQLDLAILGLNRQTYAEATDVFYGRNSFSVTSKLRIQDRHYGGFPFSVGAAELVEAFILDRNDSSRRKIRCAKFRSPRLCWDRRLLPFLDREAGINLCRLDVSIRIHAGNFRIM